MINRAKKGKNTTTDTVEFEPGTIGIVTSTYKHAHRSGNFSSKRILSLNEQKMGEFLI